MLSQVLRAGEWFLQSGIQHPDGGVARYYRLATASNHGVSTEITGYTASTLVFLHRLTGDERYLDRARAAARFLTNAWDAAGGAMPFEVSPPRFSYFFDCGIIVRGLLAVWRATADMQPLGCALAIGECMAQDFRAPDGQFHPILALPAKTPVERDRLRWSQSPGCYQLKAGMAWWDLWEATGNPCYRELYLGLREQALHNAPDFLPGHGDRRKVVDRLHAHLYFLEGLLPMPSDAILEGIERVADFARELAPQFERSDVYAQLLRMRLFAGQKAGWERECLLEFARPDGGFYFGRSAGTWEPYVNPVSAAFALQALALSNGDAAPDRRSLI